MKKLLLISSFLWILLLHVSANTGGPTFYYKFVADASPTGQGKVYASDKEVDVEKIKYSSHFGTSVISQGALVNVVTVSATAHLYAKAEEGYTFTHWTRKEGNNEVTFSHARNTTDLVTVNNTDMQNPKICNYIAHFAPIGLIYAVSSDETLGTVSNDLPSNVAGDVVTLTATADKLSGSFKGWRRNNATKLITTNPLTLEASNATKGTYTAVFEPKQTDTKGIYILMENVGTGRMFGVIGNTETTFGTDQRYFKNSMMLTDKTERTNSSPAFILKVTGQSNGTGGLNDVIIEAQGANTMNIGSRYFTVEHYLDKGYFIFANHRGFTGYLKDHGYAETGREHMEKIGEIHHPGIWNRWNYNQDYVWNFRIIDEENFSENYFGAQPSAGTLKNGKYYTTMYTAFPYECRDGVKAYTIDKMTEEGLAHFKPVPDNKVPAYTAVVLECNSTHPAQNRLMPIFDDLEPISPNLLKGEIWLNNESQTIEQIRTAFDAGTMRILSDDKGNFVNKNYSEGDQPLPYIVNNTCYLDVSGLDAPADEIGFVKAGDDDSDYLRGDANGDKSVNVTDIMVVVNYLLSRENKVFIFRNADCDENETITVTDIMQIVNIILGRN